MGQAFQPAIHAVFRGGRLESLPHKETFSAAPCAKGRAKKDPRPRRGSLVFKTYPIAYLSFEYWSTRVVLPSFSFDAITIRCSLPFANANVRASSPTILNGTSVSVFQSFSSL